MTIEQTATQTVEKAKQAATQTVAKTRQAATKTAARAKQAVELEVAKAEKLAEEVKVTATEAVQKVSDLVQAESDTVVQKVEGFVAQLKSIEVEKTIATISAEAGNVLKEIQTNGLQALKNDYQLLRTSVETSIEKLQTNSSVKTFVNGLMTKLNPTASK
jgi:hypothetical protein